MNLLKMPPIKTQRQAGRTYIFNDGAELYFIPGKGLNLPAKAKLWTDVIDALNGTVIHPFLRNMRTICLQTWIVFMIASAHATFIDVRGNTTQRHRVLRGYAGKVL